MGEEGRDEEVASSKRKTSAKIDTQFMTKTAKKTYPLSLGDLLLQLCDDTLKNSCFQIFKYSRVNGRII